MNIFRWILALIFVAVLALGWKYPLLGLLVIPMMGAGVIFALINGRWFCGNICPRGQFIDKIFSKITSTRDIPRFFLQPAFRWAFLIIFMVKMGFSLFGVYEDGINMASVASAFWWAMFGSTMIALVGGFAYNSRFWCAVCPIGTMAKSIKGVAPKNYRVSDSCKECGLCAQACPFGHNPAEFKGGEFTHSDCIKCGKCVAACRIGAIEK